jgi:hypothetical protein
MLWIAMVFNPVDRSPLLFLVTALLACGPKADNNDVGDETDSDAGTSTGEVLTDASASDPTAPTASGTATAGSATTSTSTSGEDPTATSATTVSTSTSTSATATSATDTTDTGVDLPVIPCEGEGVPLVGLTTRIGYLQSQVPPSPDTTTTTGGSSGGGELDPGTLLLKLSDQAFTCADPDALLGCGAHWSVTIVIPPEFQSPGVFNLLGQDVRGVASESGAGGGQDCSFGIGSFDATFEILAIDDKTVQGRLCHVNSPFFETDPQLEGTFDALRCP